MNYAYQDIMNYVEQEDVKFIRLAYTDIAGHQKNIAIMPEELERAFNHGISFDASAIKGFSECLHSDLFLFPQPSTLTTLPWRPSHGKVVRMFCDIRYPDGTPFEKDTRYLLKQAVRKAASLGISVYFGTEFEFYLFKTDEEGNPTKIPFDNAGYMDIAPEDKGENIRREICLNMLEMGIHPECSHHEEGPGQNEIDFRYSDALATADNAMNFLTIVKAVSSQNGLYADFSPKPLENQSGNGLHINMSVKDDEGKNLNDAFMAGILSHIRELTVFLNPCENSYKRLGEKKAPRFISWSHENRSQLIRIPASGGQPERFELRSPDPQANPYLAFAMLIHAGLDGIEKKLALPEETNINLDTAPSEITDSLMQLPTSLTEAITIAKNSEFVKSILPDNILNNLE